MKVFYSFFFVFFRGLNSRWRPFGRDCLDGEMLKGFSYFSRQQNDQQNFCTIDWSRDWGERSMRRVSTHAQQWRWSTDDSAGDIRSAEVERWSVRHGRQTMQVAKLKTRVCCWLSYSFILGIIWFFKSLNWYVDLCLTFVVMVGPSSRHNVCDLYDKIEVTSVKVDYTVFHTLGWWNFGNDTWWRIHGIWRMIDVTGKWYDLRYCPDGWYMEDNMIPSWWMIHGR